MAWSRLQSAGNAADSVPTATYGTNVTAGTKLIAVITVGNGTTTAVQDNSSNAFTKIAAVGLNGSTATGEISLWAMDTPSGDAGTKPVISFSRGTNNGGNSIVVQEIAGLASGNTVAAMIDGTPVTSSGSSGSAACGSYSTAAANEYLLACVGTEELAGGAVTGPTGSTTYTKDANSQNNTGFSTVIPAYGNSTGGAETATFTLPSQPWGTVFAAFQLTPPSFAHDAQTVDTAFTTTGAHNITHAGSADARAACVIIDQNGTAADEVSGVTYGGTAMTRLRFDTESTEAGAEYIYWLDGIAAGSQTVTVTTTAGTNKQAVVFTMTASPGASVAVAGHNSGTSASASNPSWTITGLTAGTKLEAYEGIHSGLTTMTSTPASGWTLVSSTDLGAQGRGFARQEVASSGTSLTCGWQAATADDFVGSAVAFYEAPAGTSATAGLASATGTAPAPAVTLAANATPGPASGTGTAPQVTAAFAVQGTAGAATATGTAPQPAATLASNAAAGPALATGTAPGVTAQTSAGTSAAAGLAAATGTAPGVTAAFAVQAAAGIAAAAGTAPAVTGQPAVTAAAGPATGTGTAPAPSLTLTSRAIPGAAAATGTAPGVTASTVPSASATAGLASATGTAPQPGLTLTSRAIPGPAAGTGTAPGVTGQAARQAVAGLASGTGLAPAPALTLAALAQAQAATALGQAPAVSGQGVVPAVFGTALPGGTPLTGATPGGVPLTAATPGGQALATATASDAAFATADSGGQP